jgi:hypothetical protein
MAKINVTQGTAGAYGAGELQLENKVQMTATLTPVTDNLNTASPLKLSTTGIQATSKIQITTAETSYIDAEDNSGNNRFTVGRDPSSQLVTVDFASLPTALTTPVGAIRTGTDGVNLANVMTFLENGNIGINTDTAGAKLDVHSASNVIAQFNRTGTGNSQIQYLMTGTARWTTGFVSATGNYSIFDNVNSLFRTNLSNTGKLTIGNGDTALTGQLNVKGSGSTSATTSLLVQNSAGTQIIKSTDNGVTQIGAYDNSSIGSTLPLQVTATGTNNAGIAIYANGTGNAGFDFYRNASFKFNVGVDSGNNFSWYNAGFAGYSFVIQGDSTGRIVFGGTTGSASAQVSVDSTTRGFLPPRMTTTQKNAIATPAAGLMVYDSTLNKLCVYTTAWETITSI